jgi:hypothetical protein
MLSKTVDRMFPLLEVDKWHEDTESSKETVRPVFRPRGLAHICPFQSLEKLGFEVTHVGRVALEDQKWATPIWPKTCSSWRKVDNFVVW